MATIPWTASAALENVVRAGNDLAEVTSLEGCVRAWLELDDVHKRRAELVMEKAFQFQDEGYTRVFHEEGIAELAKHLPT